MTIKLTWNMNHGSERREYLPRLGWQPRPIVLLLIYLVVFALALLGLLGWLAEHQTPALVRTNCDRADGFIACPFAEHQETTLIPTVIAVTVAAVAGLFAAASYALAYFALQAQHIQRFEEVTAEEVDALLDHMQLIDLVARLRLRHPPRRPSDLELRRAVKEPTDRAWVCVIISRTSDGQTRVRLRWISARTTDAAFNFIASAYGWRPVSAGPDSGETQPSAYLEGCSLVLIEPERCPQRGPGWWTRFQTRRSRRWRGEGLRRWYYEGE